MNLTSCTSSVRNTKCRMLFTLALLATLYYQIVGKLTMKPRHTEVKVNHSTYFNCSTDLGSSDIFWFHGDDYIYVGRVILEPYHERFSVEKNEWNGTYMYNLVIQSVQPGDAGEYRCEEDEGFGEKCPVQLIVLDFDPVCRSNMELSGVIGQNTCNIEPDEVEFECSVMYHGHIPPQVEWKKVGANSSTSFEVSSVTYRNHYITTLKLRGDIALNNSSYICELTRTAQEPIRCTSKVMTILYALGANSTVNKTIGDELLCEANTSQSCSYTWKWLQDEDVTVEYSASVLKAKKTGWHKCEAECYLSNQTCNLLVMQAMVYGKTDFTQPWIIIIAVLYVVALAAAAVAVLIFVKCYSIHNREETKVGRLSEPTLEECVPLNYIPVIDAPTNEPLPGAYRPFLKEPEIRGLTILHQEVFILRLQRQDIEVYDSKTLHFKRRMTVDGMTYPGNIVSCNVNNCLYTADSSYQNLRESAILRIDPIKGNLIKEWTIYGCWNQLSVASDANVILCTISEANLREYTADGQLVRTIDLGLHSDGRITRYLKAAHAVKLDNGLFVVCQSSPSDVYLLSTKESSTRSKMGRIDEVEILKKFSEEPGQLIYSFKWPEYISVNKEGSILVSDKLNYRAVLLSQKFHKAQILLSEEDRMNSPNRTCFDESTGQWFVTDGRRIMVCRVEEERVEREIYDLRTHYELICNAT